MRYTCAIRGVGVVLQITIRGGCYKKLQLYISRIDCPEQGSIEKICNSSGYDYKSVRVYLTERYM